MYKPIQDILTKKFSMMGEESYLEDTSKGVFSQHLQEALELTSLHILRVEKFSPDLTGYYKKTKAQTPERIVVEIKGRKIRIKDIYQTKMYADILNVTYCILVSSVSLTREIREFVKQRNLLWRQGKNVIISKYQKDLDDIIIEPMVLQDIYHGNPPDPFRINERTE